MHPRFLPASWHTCLLQVALLLGLVLGVGPSASADQDIVFETIQSPAFIGKGPGPDGLVGTDDDVDDPRNTAGTVAYGISQLGLLLLYSEATTTIREPFVFVNGRSTITDFSTTGTLGPDISFSDSDPEIEGYLFPHELLTDLDGRTDGDYHLAYCEGGLPCVQPGDVSLFPNRQAALFSYHSGRGLGFLLLRGEDPYSLPGIDPDLASYLDSLTDIVPPDWTAIAIKTGGLLECATWDPAASGLLVSTEEETRAFYARLDPSDTEVLTSLGVSVRERFIYRNFEAVEEFNSASTGVTIQIAQLLDGPDETPGSFVGVQARRFSIQHDNLCLFESPGNLVTHEGAGTNPEGTWRSNSTAARLGLTGGVVATVSTSPIMFEVMPTQVEIDVDPNSDANLVDPSDPGSLAVAILGGAAFEVSDIDVTTLAFGPAEATPESTATLAGVDSTLERVDFSSSVFRPGQIDPSGTVSGTFGVYDVPPGTSAVPVVASNIEFTATGVPGFNGSFGGFKSVFGSMSLDFTDDPPALVGQPFLQPVLYSFLEDDQMRWRLDPGTGGIPGPPHPTGSVRPTALLSPGEMGTLTFTTTPIPAPDVLVSNYAISEIGFAMGETEVCITGELLDGTFFEGCDVVVVPEPHGLAVSAVVLLLLGTLARRRVR